MMTTTLYLSPHYSRYAQRALQANPQLYVTLAEALHSSWSKEKLLSTSQSLCHQFGVFSGLRQFRTVVMLSLMERDLQQLSDVQEVMQIMTWLAEISVQNALDILYRQLCNRYGTPRGKVSGLTQDLWVIGMGKLGGQELNVSSDIDLVYLYEEEGMTDGGQQYAAISNHEFFDRLAKQLTFTLSEVNEYGFVFRVDLRLRPNGNAGFLACSLAMLKSYFSIQAGEWERFAWLKARLLFQSSSAIRCQFALQKIIQDFVYRPYLDFKILFTLRDLKTKIRSYSKHNQSIDIKLHPGGIRDIEFTVQTFQLIYGGQFHLLCNQSTLITLNQLCQYGLTTSDITDNLIKAYHFLRQLEHRVQYLDDAQTHFLPKNPKDQIQLAHSMGYINTIILFDELQKIRTQVQHDCQQISLNQFDIHTQLSLWDQAIPCYESKKISEKKVITNDNNPRYIELKRPYIHKTFNHALTPYFVRTINYVMAHKDKLKLLSLLQHVQISSPYRDLDNLNKRHVDLLMRCILDKMLQKKWARQSEKLYTVMARILDLINVVSLHHTYLTLLIDHPQALTRIIDILATSQWAALYLTQYPALLSELVEEAQPEPDNYLKIMTEDIRTKLLKAQNHADAQMDILRHIQRSRTFQILLRDLQGLLSLEKVADYLSELADMLLALTLEIAWSQINERHCEYPRFAIAAYGRLGGKELGYASDLDLVFLYDDPYEGAQEIYSNLARKLMTWLTTYTGTGILYDVDLRLRPNGDAGLLVTDLAAFQRYQLGESENSAWVWEHQALVRARFCAGNTTIGRAFEHIRTQVLSLPRNSEQLRKEILAMRERILKAHPSTDTYFDIKHGQGGMIDIEFIVQYLVLLHSRQHPQLLANAGNISLLYFAAEAKLIDNKIAKQVAHVYRTLRALQHQYRLNGIHHPRIPQMDIPKECQCVNTLWQSVFFP